MSEGEEDHEIYSAYLSDLPGADLRALRHLLACPLCQTMTRLLLAPPAPEAVQELGRWRRPRPRGRKAASTRRVKRERPG